MLPVLVLNYFSDLPASTSHVACMTQMSQHQKSYLFIRHRSVEHVKENVEGAWKTE